MENNIKLNTALFAIFTGLYLLMLLYYFTYPDYSYIFLGGVTVSAWLCGLVFRDMLKELGW